MNVIEQKRILFMFVCLTQQTENLVHVCSFIKPMNINERST